MRVENTTEINDGYRRVCDAVLACGMYGKRPGIAIMRDLLKKHGHPERGFRFVHIAGTNGKGSTAYYTAKLLAAAGKTVGLYTSPHLAEVTERIRVNGEEIPREDFARIAALYLEETEVTASDLLLLAALVWFREKNCEYAVIETGLGGAYDSTNALTDGDMGGAAAVSVITNIGCDHTAVLGESLTEIAEAKAGILKRGTHAVLAEMPDEALQVLVQRCEDLKIPYTLVKEQSRTAAWLKKEMPELSRTYQRRNAANAVTAFKVLEVTEPVSDGIAVNEAEAFRQMANTTVPGRLQVLQENPTVIVDGAHNPQGAEALAESMAALYPDETFDCVVGIVRDKDPAGILGSMASLMHTAAVAAVGAGGRRSDVEGLCRQIAERGIPVTACETAQEALERQKNRAAGDGGHKVLVFGSLYLVGEIIRLYGISNTDGRADSLGAGSERDQG